MSVPYNDSQYPIRFPRQKVPYAKKIANDKEWFRQCIDSSERMALYGYQTDHKKMFVLYDMDNDIIDEQEMERVFNPMGLEESTFPASTKNYPISTPKIDLLQGEELKRRFDWTVRAKNLDTESADQTTISDMMMEILIAELQKESTDQAQFEKRLNEFAKYAKYSWKSKHELTATRILQYLWRDQALQSKFNDGFRDGLVGGRECYRIDVEGREPIVSREDPRTIYPIRLGQSNRLEDADGVVQITYEPLNRVIDAFYDELTSAQIDKLENLHSRTLDGGHSALGYKNEAPQLFSNLDFNSNGAGFASLNDFNGQGAHPGLPFDKQGNIRVVRARWIGRKLVNVLKYYNEDGEEAEMIVSEFHKPNETAGETVTPIWINEAYEGAKLAADIYVKMQRRDVQMRHMDNYSRCFLGYVGSMYGRSIMARMEPYQYLYNVYMRRLEMIMAKYKGPIYELDVSKIPDDWEMDKWMYYADVLGWAVIDNFNEGKKGAATGKIAGTFNSSGKVLDPNIGNYIQQIVLMLQHIEDIMGKISGVTDQRLGQIDNRETVGGVERAVTQSSHITEKLFFIHDETKKRVLAALLDTTKFAWRNSKSKKLNFVLDDMSRMFVDLNPEDIASTDYDLFITNSSVDLEIRQGLKSLAQAAVQNGAKISTYIDILTTESMSDMIRKLDASDDELQQRAENAQKLAQDSQQQLAQMQMESAQADRDIEYARMDMDLEIATLDADTRYRIAQLTQMGKDVVPEAPKGDDGRAKLDLEKRKHMDNLALEYKKLNETTRSNVAKESIARSKPKVISK